LSYRPPGRKNAQNHCQKKALSRQEQVDYLAVRHFSSWPNGLFSRIAQNLRNKDIGADGFLESLWLDLKLDVGSGFDLVAEKIREVDLHGVDWDAKELPSTARDWIKKRIAEAKEFLKTRESWSTEDLVATYQEEHRKATLERQEEYRKTTLERIAAWDKKALYNAPEATKPDFSRWCQRSHWFLDQAIVLSLGKDPVAVNPTAVKELHHKALKELGQTTDFLSNYFDRMTHLKKAITAKHLTDPLTPDAFIKWAQASDLKLPGELTGRAGNKTSSELDVDYMQPRKLHVLYSLLLAAASKYDKKIKDYDPNKHVSTVPSQVSHELKQAGWPVGKKTIQTHLKAAAAWARGEKPSDADSVNEL
jgi:hypothetical protein